MSDDELDPGLQGYSDSGSDFHDLPEPALPEGVRKTILSSAPAGGWTLKRPTAGDAVKFRCSESASSILADLQDDQGLICLDIGSGRRPRLETAATTMRHGEVAKFDFSMGLEATGAPLSLELTLAEWTPRLDLFEDGRAIKSLLRRCDDRRRPVIGQVCLVQCVLRGEGCDEALWMADDLQHVIEDMPPPESSHRFEFGIKEGWKLMDKALLSMRRGERCEVRVGTALLRGGAPGGLLPAAVEGDGFWILQLELREFIETADVSFEKDGSLYKRSLRCRDDWASWLLADDGQTCTLRVLDVKDSKGTVLCSDATLDFRVGLGEVCDALECAASSMREDEIAELKCSDFQLCKEPRLGMEDLADGVAIFNLHLTARSRSAPSDQRGRDADEEKLQVLSQRKTAATELFKAGRYRLAAHRFRVIHEQLGYIDDFRGVRGGEERQRQVGELKKACLLNRALCLLKAGYFKRAIQACDLVLDMEPTNEKGLFRRAEAHLGLDDTASAARDLKALPGTSKELTQLREKVRRRQKQLDSECQGLYAKMCTGLGNLPHPLDVD